MLRIAEVRKNEEANAPRGILLAFVRVEASTLRYKRYFGIHRRTMHLANRIVINASVGNGQNHRKYTGKVTLYLSVNFDKQF